MKKIFLLTFVTFCSLIFYQIVLGKNGVIEGYRINKEKERLLTFISLLKNEIQKNSQYIEYLKNDPHALKSFAEELGYFDGDNVKLIRVIEELSEKDLDKAVNEIKYNNEVDKSIQEIVSDVILDNKVNKIRLWLSVFFYIFFGFFIFLILFGVKKSEE